ncbi:IS66 family insertion sequence element accessory protein TnpB [Bacteroides fragilis]|nr:IS66 family insertion sequence element accessory protein TnpB [Bacteroides fragilis]MCS2878908.1 IS66 family insertion sequence element accessory protein TnpB [Bacteroides fragilis]
MSEQSCHIFPDRSRSRLHILYRCDDEYRLECRRLNRGSFLLKKEERKKDFLQISWNRLNELLTVKKYRKTVEK